VPNPTTKTAGQTDDEAAALDCLLAALDAADGRPIQALVFDTDERVIEVWLVELTYRFTVDYCPEELGPESVVVARPGRYIDVDLINQATSVLLPGVPLYRVICRCCSGLADVNTCGYCRQIDDHHGACPLLQPDEPKTVDSPRLVAHREWDAGYTARRRAADNRELLPAAREQYKDPATSARWKLGFDDAEWEQI
jgi:hypothetical protein